MKETIYISTEEEINSVIAKVKSETADKILLVVPAGAHLFLGSLNFKVLKKFCDEQKKDVTVVSSDKTGRSLAELSGLATLSKIETKKREMPVKPVMVSVVRRKIESEPTNDKTSHSDSAKLQMTDLLAKNKMPFERTAEEAFSVEKIEPEKTVEVELEEPAKQKNWKLYLRAWRLGKVGKILSSFIGLSFIVILFVLFLVLPKVDITLVMHTSAFAYKTTLTVNTALDQKDDATNTIPGKKYEQALDKNFKFQSTGKRAIGEKAKGVLKLKNKTGMTQPLVQNTQLQSADGHILRLNDGVILPPGSETQVNVTADQPGAAYNVSAGKFIVVKLWEGLHDSIFGESTEPMAGGTDLDQPYISQDDLNKASEKSKTDIVQEAINQIRGKLPSDKVLLDAAISIDSFEVVSSQPVEAQVAEFNIQAKIKISAIAYIKADYEAQTSKQIATQLNKDQKVIDVKLDTVKHTTQVDAVAGVMKVETSGEAVIGRVLFEDALKSKLVGKTTGDAESFLTSQPSVDRITINYWPFWVKRVPVQDGRIFLKAEYVKD